MANTTKYRPRYSEEPMQQYLEEKRSWELANLGESGVEFFPGQNKVPRYSPDDKVKEYYEGMDTTAPTAQEEADIREQERKYIQSQIDYIEQQYGKALTAEEEAGKERYGRTRAILSAGGLLGTPMGGTAKEQTQRYTTEQKRLLDEEKVTKINALLDKALENAQTKIEKLQTEAKVNAKEFMKWQTGLQIQNQTLYSQVAKTMTLEQLKQVEEADGKSSYDIALENTGMKPGLFDLWYKSNYDTAEYPEPKITWDSKGNARITTYDKTTGKLDVQIMTTEELGIPQDTEITFIENDNGVKMPFEKITDESGNISYKSIAVEGVSGVGKPEEEKAFWSQTDYQALSIKGVPKEAADAISLALNEGISLDQIRQGLKVVYGQETGFGYLDIVIPYLEEKVKKEGQTYKLVPQ